MAGRGAIRTAARRLDARHWAMAASGAAALLMLVGKLAAYFLTGSSAIFADAAESLIHLAATGFAAFALWYSSRPPDPDHPYGHARIAFFSAGFEGALILVAAGSIFYTSIRALVDGPELQRLGLGIVITAGLGLVNLALGMMLVRVGRRHGSIVLVANGQHVLTDMWTSVGVVGGVTIVHFTGIQWIDPLTGLAVALQIVVTAMRLLRRSYQGLMDHADVKHTAALRRCLEEAVDRTPLAGFHQLRYRAVDDEMWVEVHLLVPDGMVTSDAHRLVTDIERAMREAVPQGRVTITSHVEPTSHAAAHPSGHEQVDALVAEERPPAHELL